MRLHVEESNSDERMTKTEFLWMIQARTAEMAIGASTLRNQGAANVVSTTREFLKRLELRTFNTDIAEGFRKSLDEQTNCLGVSLPQGAQSWGAARKALNIFLRDVLYSHYLSEEYGFERLEPWLELPLDGDSARSLRLEPEGKGLTRWEGVKYLVPNVSDDYQLAAERVANRLQIARVHLDLIYWRREKRALANPSSA